MRHAGNLIVGTRAAERFVVDRLSRRALNEIRAAQSHERGAFDHDDDVRQRGQICATGDARAHHRRDLRHLQISAHDRVVIENSGCAVLSRKDAALIRQIHAG